MSGFPSRVDHFDSKGMNAAGEFGREGVHDGAVAGEARQRREAIARDAYAKMRAPTLAPTGVTMVPMALVNHFKMARHEFDRKFFDNDVTNRHIPTVSALALCGA